MQEHVDFSDVGIRERVMFAELVDLFSLERIVELLHVLLCEETQRLFAERRSDMILDHAPVTVDCALPKCRLCVVSHPFFHPLTERHAAVFGEVNVFVFLDHLMQLRYLAGIGLSSFHVIFIGREPV